MASAICMRDHKSDSTEIRSKIWKINLETSERTLGVTSHRFSRSYVPSLAINDPTNYRMLMHDSVDKLFYM